MFKYIFIFLFILPSLYANEETFKFVVFGDMPYDVPWSKYGRQHNDSALLEHIFPGLIDEKNEGHRFLIHYGDTISGSTPCHEETLTKNLKLIANVFPGKTFITPGDNDWTDCDRKGFSELSSFDLFMNLIEQEFSYQKDFAHQYQLKKQESSPLNQIWVTDSIIFSTLHIVGTDNGRREILVDDKKKALEAVATRDRQNKDWIDKAFKKAITQNARAIVFTFHADITKAPKNNEYANIECTNKRPENCDAFLNYRKQFKEYAQKYPHMSILLIHGDTGELCLDKPFNMLGINNIWRLNGPGDYAHIDMAVVKIDLNNEKEPFSAKTILHDVAVPKSCTRNKN